MTIASSGILETLHVQAINVSLHRASPAAGFVALCQTSPALENLRAKDSSTPMMAAAPGSTSWTMGLPRCLRCMTPDQLSPALPFSRGISFLYFTEALLSQYIYIYYTNVYYIILYYII